MSKKIVNITMNSVLFYPITGQLFINAHWGMVVIINVLLVDAECLL